VPARSLHSALAAVGDRKLGLEVGVLLAQPLVLGAQRLEALTQRCLGRALPGGDAIGSSGSVIAQPLDLAAQSGVGVEPLARDAGTARNRLEADQMRQVLVEVDAV
jgi:hypothetical protein